MVRQKQKQNKKTTTWTRFIYDVWSYESTHWHSFLFSQISILSFWADGLSIQPVKVFTSLAEIPHSWQKYRNCKDRRRKKRQCELIGSYAVTHLDFYGVPSRCQRVTVTAEIDRFVVPSFRREPWRIRVRRVLDPLHDMSRAKNFETLEGWQNSHPSRRSRS